MPEHKTTKMSHGVAWLLVLCSLTSSAVARSVGPGQAWSIIQNTEFNDRPIIGMLTEPTVDPAYEKYGEEYISSIYVDFVVKAGARVVPIRAKQSPEYYRQIFNNINGVYFPGGDISFSYFMSAKFMYDLAIEANDNGDYFPVWGTCLGLQIFSMLTTGRKMLRATDARNLSLPLDFVDGYQESRLFRDMPADLVDYVRSQAVAQNNHAFGLLLEDYENTPQLTEFYKLLTTNFDRKGVQFVSTWEAYNYPFYALQWHPEKAAYAWYPFDDNVHTATNIRVNDYMANFFVNEARKNSHRFATTEDEVNAVVENALRVFTADDHFLTYYFFNYTRPLSPYYV